MLLRHLLLKLLFLLLLPSAVIAQSGNFSSLGATASPNYKIQPKDILRVEVFQEPDLLKDVRVEADGTIALPLIGHVKVGGLRLGEAKALITELYDRDYLVNPQVTVIVLSYAEQRVQVLGQVNAPGFVLIPPEEGMTLVAAISGARGFTALANQSRVELRRARAEGGYQLIEVDVRQVLRDPNSQDIQLQDGDIIYVRERIF